MNPILIGKYKKAPQSAVKDRLISRFIGMEVGDAFKQYYQGNDYRTDFNTMVLENGDHYSVSPPVKQNAKQQVFIPVVRGMWRLLEGNYNTSNHYLKFSLVGTEHTFNMKLDVGINFLARSFTMGLVSNRGIMCNMILKPLINTSYPKSITWFLTHCPDGDHRELSETQRDWIEAPFNQWLVRETNN